MTIVREPVHTFVHKPPRKGPQPRPAPHHRSQPRGCEAKKPLGPHQPDAASGEPHVDVYLPRRGIRVDTTFWQHRSIFAGTQEQLNQLRREADDRAARRARLVHAEQLAKRRAAAERWVVEAHRPVFRRLKVVVHVGLVPMLWAITTCRCGQRWPCNDITQYVRKRLGWNVDINEQLKLLTRRLPKPATRLTRLRRALGRWRRDSRQRGTGVGGSRAWH